MHETTRSRYCSTSSRRFLIFLSSTRMVHLVLIIAASWNEGISWCASQLSRSSDNMCLPSFVLSNSVTSRGKGLQGSGREPVDSLSIAFKVPSVSPITLLGFADSGGGTSRLRSRLFSERGLTKCASSRVSSSALNSSCALSCIACFRCVYSVAASALNSSLADWRSSGG